ncbi:5-bromo-4-chloroindolyl phosphate hydrolysis family protein [Roseicyclus sp. F158]|uniref:5-bromo-4-chloroindolyl phosphate hydrolysis family protein n=1 Tax=Tropicimonas omnivorans TaxID=3075590 RepID=A0ABU3DFP9_9RHOB|nr:5-bromo-4-chloroindolyl phosphate hydrolysis family protein [Roseicyclus sp. F158]MDT0682515.1 5-bromo-4-chloroindolyl phosphate hydrolysis family protein [Roseicyclus sp. F158]
MAERFGGRYSPGPGGTDRPPRGAGRRMADTPARTGPRRGRGRTNLLYLAPLPLLWTGLASSPLGMAADFAACAVLVFAAWMLSEGLEAERAFQARKIARRPALPRKILASVLTGAGVALAAFPAEAPALLGPAILGLIATILHVTAFGLDPLRDKGMGGAVGAQADRAQRAVEEGEAVLSDMEAAARRTGERKVVVRVASFAAAARRMFRTVEEDPRDLAAARRYLSVYLVGARDAAVKYEELARRRPDPGARADFLSLLDDLEANFAARTTKLLDSDRQSLDIEIDVLRDRLAREGVDPERN